MFEFLMLIGFLGAGLCHWQPRWAAGEEAGPEKRSRGKGDGQEVKVQEREPRRKATGDRRVMASPAPVMSMLPQRLLPPGGHSFR